MAEATDMHESDWSAWFSTYGILTSQRILERLNIRLKQEDLIAAIKNPSSFYHQVLLIPLKNIFNGIILQQTRDYQAYAQKQFVDYLLSGQHDKDKDAQGSEIRKELEHERAHLVELGEQFANQELAHQRLIASSQASFISWSKELQESLQNVTRQLHDLLQKKGIVKEENLIQKAIRGAMAYFNQIDNVSSSFWIKTSGFLEVPFTSELSADLVNLSQQLNEHREKIDELVNIYLEKTQEVSEQLKHYRRQFYQVVLKTRELLKLLPEYHPDETRDAENLAELNFDSSIGESGRNT